MTPRPDFVVGPLDTHRRCAWCGTNPLYQRYHDEEWGRKDFSDARMFEFLLLETFQAGLSWWTILRKREAFRTAFAQFDAQTVAAMSDEALDDLMHNAEIVRNRAKIRAARSNARAFLSLCGEWGSFKTYLDSFEPDPPRAEPWRTLGQIPAQTAFSDRISADLKKRGFRFTGSTVLYAHLQACGYVNDHLEDCWVYADCATGYPVGSVVSARASRSETP
ncbi:DNA-3-methyladenine glycosylase I [bacterium]|nr:DNA-3-methyladenine glycosylase I [bacterium]